MPPRIALFAAVSACLIFLLAVLLALCVAAWVTYVPLVARGMLQVPWLRAEPQEALGEGQLCRFPAADGLLLAGTYLPTTATERMGVLVGCHELTGDRWSMLPYVADLRARGFDVFLFDFRNHGTSAEQPRYEPLPWLTRGEVADVEGAIAYVCSRPDADPRGVGLFGVSRGGAAALAVAARNRRVAAVVTDGAFGTLSMQVHYIRRYMSIFTLYTRFFSRLPNCALAMLVRIAQLCVGYARGVRFVGVEQAARRVRQPVLMIHGEIDPYVPLPVVQYLRRCLPKRTTLWLVAGARHNQSLATDPVAYRRRVARFFLKHLAFGRRISTPTTETAALEAASQG